MDYYKNQNASAPNIVHAHAVAGEPVSGVYGVVAEGPIQPAGLHSTAPYKPPKRRHRDNPNKLLCSFEGCKAYPTKKYAPWCAGHAVTMGLVPHPKTGKLLVPPDGNAG